MGDSCCDLADRRHLLRLDELVLRFLEHLVHALHRRVERRQLDNPVGALDMHPMIGDDQREQARHRLSAIEVIDLVFGMSGSPVDRDGADDSLGNAQRPAHRGMCRAIPSFMHPQRQPGLGDIAVDQQGLAGRHDVAEYAGAAREAAANHAGRQIDARGDFEQVFSPLDTECNRSALCIEPGDDVLEDVLLHLQRRRAAGGGLA